MKKIFFFFVILITVINHSTAQVEFYLNKESNKYGVKNQSDKKAKNPIIEPKYDSFRHANCGHQCYIITVGNLKGIVNFEGVETITPEYDDFKFDCSIQINTGNDRTLTTGGLLMAEKNEKICWVNYVNGNQITPFYDSVFNYSYKENNYSRVYLNGKIGLLERRTGKELIPVKYDDYEIINKYYFKVKLNGKWGVIDSSKNEVIPVIFDNSNKILQFSENLFFVNQNEQFVLLDSKGKRINSKEYESVNVVSKYFAHVKHQDEYYLIDSDGNEMLSSYSYFANEKEELIFAVKNGKVGFIDETGKVIIPFKYATDFITVYDGNEGFNDGLASVAIYETENDGKIEVNSDGLHTNSAKLKFGFIDKTGKVLIPFKYDDAGNFNNGKAKVVLDGREFYIDKNGNKLP